MSKDMGFFAYPGSCCGKIRRRLHTWPRIHAYPTHAKRPLSGWFSGERPFKL